MVRGEKISAYLESCKYHDQDPTSMVNPQPEQRNTHNLATDLHEVQDIRGIANGSNTCRNELEVWSYHSHSTVLHRNNPRRLSVGNLTMISEHTTSLPMEEG